MVAFPPQVSPRVSPRVSIVIPTYNQAEFLRECLVSVLAQTMGDWEAIVVNNYSQDDTRDVALSFGDPRITIVDFANHGVIAASRNVGWRRATAEWVAFLDSDDLWDTTKLETCLAAAGEDVDFISHRERYIKDGKVIGITDSASPRQAEFTNLLLCGNIFSPSGIMVRRALLEAVGGMAEDPEINTAEDHDLWLKLAARNVRVRFINRPLGDFRVHDSQNSNAVERHMKASLAVLDRHGSGRADVSAIGLRRARARIIYAAGRTHQKLGRPAQASALFMQSLAKWPFHAKTWIALGMAGVAGLRRTG